MKIFQGRTLYFTFLDDVSAVCLIDWLANICKTAFTPPKTSVCKGHVNGLGDTVPRWDLQDLTGALQKIVNQEQVSVQHHFVFSELDNSIEKAASNLFTKYLFVHLRISFVIKFLN